MMTNNLRGRAFAARVAVGLFLLTGCSSNESTKSTDALETAAATPATSEGGFVVAASFYPLAEIVQAIGGDQVEVLNLTPVGVGPHDLELKPQDLENLEKAALVVYLGKGFQPLVEKAATQLPASVVRLDVLDAVKLLGVDPVIEGVVGETDGEVLAGDVDPHIWVDPVRFAEMAKAVEVAMTKARPDSAEMFAANLLTYTKTLTDLDSEFAAGLKTCESRAIVTSHRAFGYLSNRYVLKQLPIAGISPDEEPNPKSLEAVAAAAKKENVTVIFFESLVPKALADTVAKEIGATTDSLNPIEGLTQEELDAGTSYVSLQQANLAALRNGLRCS